MHDKQPAHSGAGDQPRKHTVQRRFRVAAQGHLFARPLIYGLEAVPEIDLSVISPPSLADMLLCCDMDCALLPSIDLQGNAGGFAVIPAGCVACTGRTLMARVFSRVRPAKLTALYADVESHTSTALAQVLWSHVHGTRLDVLPFDPARQEVPDETEGLLLLGDKVVTAPPLGFDWQIDLGAMWHEITGLPFVFAVWTAGDPADCKDLYRILTAARKSGLAHLNEIIQQHALPAEWPEDLAAQFLTKHMSYEFGPAEREGMEEFFSMAVEHGVIDEMIPVRYYQPAT